MNTYEIYEPNLKTLIDKVTRLNAKLARINVLPITWKQVGHRDETFQDDPMKMIRFIKLEVEGVIPEQNGWQFVATLVHTEDGNIIRAVPGYTVPVEYRDRPTWCDHCKTNRIRRDTYIVRHEDGRVMQVGSNCLEDFIGAPASSLTKAVEHLLNAYDICDAAQKREWLGGTNALHIFRIDLDTFLQNVAAVVLKQGHYITRKIARESVDANGYAKLIATSDTAMTAMNNRGGMPWPDQDYPVTDEVKKLATEAREWVLKRYSPTLADPDAMNDDAIRDMVIGSFKAANTALSEFEHNLLSCARAEAIEPRLGGIAAYIIEAYRRAQPRPQPPCLNSEGLARIFDMFKAAAKSELKRPAIRLADEAGNHIHLSMASAASKNAGCIYVKGDRPPSGRFENYQDRPYRPEAPYFGKIVPDGRFFRAGDCPSTIEVQLQMFAADPETIATKYGRMTGCCCFCGRRLKDERSTTVGYGPVCSEKYGLSWGKHAEQTQAADPVTDLVVNAGV